ncbi:unnamed protein product [Vitrella brassicaformis CCMP3155]|uniref:Formiminotransferase N-terminal subdomain domain-containing protein n=2 Tax=Vitrella brassicaformis TaxID=1169539 RepID=A0A0G4GYS2_VITBC|nr:unnamed protein product [Vitrella brassicaformis CCMP3155]|eukprot:CEM36305.1 unnamed protein product [Vitrella brassicaformis CCMP3155]
MRRYLACNVFISEAHSAAVLAQVQTHLTSHRAALLFHFKDAIYNRSSFLLAAPLVAQPTAADTHKDQRHSPELLGGVLQASRYLWKHLSLEGHQATHPRVGLIDHISVHPLGDSTLGDALAHAQAVGKALGEECGIPVFMYGAPVYGTLVDARRRTRRYFSHDAADQDQPLCSDFGPSVWDPRTGVAVVGAVPWFTAFNLPFTVKSNDAAILRRVKDAMLGVREKRGGLHGVHALILDHGNQGRHENDDSTAAAEGVFFGADGTRVPLRLPAVPSGPSPLYELACNVYWEGTGSHRDVRAIISAKAREVVESAGLGECVGWGEGYVIGFDSSGAILKAATDLFERGGGN